jgi:4-amino-4-deoxy-L-arabinose transferase-like glycosyltransferase
MSKNKYLILIIILGLFFSFWKLGARDLNEWDESEYGQNAFEMLKNGDYVNYYYAGQLDTWNAKPPLSIWLITLGYKIFGYNAFALRFFSALSASLFFVFAFKIVKLYGNDMFALITCLILISCKAIIGFHVGRTGDADALLLLFITTSLYYSLLFIDFQKATAIIPASIFLGLAFYAKGTAAFLLIPGIFIYILTSGRLKEVLYKRKFWLGFTICLFIIGSWIFLLSIKGKQFGEGAYYSSHSALETLFFHDTFSRVLSSKFEGSYAPDRTFFFRVIDVRMNLWNYLFYLTVLIGAINLIVKKSKLDKLSTLSLCLGIPVILLLTFAANKHDWYMAPVFLFLAIIIAKGILNISQGYRFYHVIWIGIFIFNICSRFYEITFPKRETISFFEENNNRFKAAPVVNVVDMPSQDYFLYLNWYSKEIVIRDGMNSNLGGLSFIDRRKTDPMRYKILSCKNFYCLTM